MVTVTYLHSGVTVDQAFLICNLIKRRNNLTQILLLLSHNPHIVPIIDRSCHVLFLHQPSIWILRATLERVATMTHSQVSLNLWSLHYGGIFIIAPINMYGQSKTVFMLIFVLHLILSYFE